MSRSTIATLLALGTLVSGTAWAKTWHVHNRTDEKYNVLFQATGCLEFVSCGTGGEGEKFGRVCKKTQVGPQEDISYGWGIGGQSDKRVIVCPPGAGTMLKNTDRQTYICPQKQPGSNNPKFELSKKPCDS